MMSSDTYLIFSSRMLEFWSSINSSFLSGCWGKLAKVEGVFFNFSAFSLSLVARGMGDRSIMLIDFSLETDDEARLLFNAMKSFE